MQHASTRTALLGLLLVCVLLPWQAAKAQVGIGVAAPEANAMLEVTSTTRGLLIPRLTTAQRIGVETTLDAVAGAVNRARIDGMMVYDLNLHQLFYYDEAASSWVVVSSGGAGANTTLSNITTTSIPAGANIQFAANNSNNIGTTTNGVSNIYLSGAAGSINRGIWVGSARALTLDVVNANIFSAGGSGTITGVGNNIIGFGAGVASSPSANNNSLFGYNAGGSISTGNNNVLVGTGAGGTLNTGTFNVAIGSGSSVAPAAASAIAIGSSANAGVSGIAIGPSTLIVGTSSVGIGLTADVAGNNSVSIGPNSVVTGNNSVAIGNGAEAAGLNSVAIGQLSQANGTNSASFLAGTVTQAGAIVIGGGTNSVGLGVLTPTSRLHLPGGTNTAGTAPLKFSSGANLTTPELGALEFDGTDLFFTKPGPTRVNLSGGGTGVNFDVSTFQNSTSPTNYLFDIQSNSTGLSQGARLQTVAGGASNNATGLTITASATGTGTATALNVSASGGTGPRYAALFAGGNVGIGVAAPGRALDVQTNAVGVDAGGFRINNAGSNAVALFTTSNGTGNNLLAVATGTGPSASIEVNNTASTAPALAVTTNSTAGGPSATFQGGRVGIGTTSPNTKAILDLVSPVAANTEQVLLLPRIGVAPATIEAGGGRLDPASTVNGSIYYNNTSTQLRALIAGTWVSLGGGAAFDPLNINSNLVFTGVTARQISIAPPGANNPGRNLTIGASDGGGTAATSGGTLELRGGNAAGAGTAAGGNIILTPGTAIGGGTPGAVGIGTPSPGFPLTVTTGTNTFTASIANTGATSSHSGLLLSVNNTAATVFDAQSVAISRLTVLGDGQIRTPSIHNNGGTGGPTAGAIASGTYTPVISAWTSQVGTPSGVQTATANSFRWSRVGNVVTVSGNTVGTFGLAGGPSRVFLNIPLPFGGSIAQDEASGVAMLYFVNVPTFDQGRGIVGRITGGPGTFVRVLFADVPNNTASNELCTFTFQYEVK